MHSTIYLELSYEFEVKASAKEVFKVLSDVPTSASFYPGVDKLVDEGNAIYRWEMEPRQEPHHRKVFTSHAIPPRPHPCI